MILRVRLPHTERRRRHAEHGYSLLEVLVVLSIVALIATFVGPRLFAQLDRSKATAARVQIQSMMSALETMRLDIGRYPEDAEGLRILVEPPAARGDEVLVWRGPYLDAVVPDDPWGRPYVYTAPSVPNERPHISSYGGDGKLGGEGVAADIATNTPG